MADFMGSINDGLNAAKKADENRAEITSVMDELNLQLGMATNNCVRLITRSFYKEEPVRYQTMAEKIMGVSLSDKPREAYTALAISHTNKDYGFNDIEVAKWSVDKNGYPCVIKLGSDELYCEDKEALEAALAELMRDTDVGAAVLKCMNFRPKAK
ncbi:hypothetical protein [Serratia marcescens]|uniref:hypothetical protein n=1 Tax=Serratia marcescens TaxID=615 RepID=UPI002361BB62|nr:hypothetical protein [Serratia marcescens]